MSYGTPPPPPPPAYGYGSGPSPYGGPPPDHKQATLILVFGILSIICCGIFLGIPAIVLGRKALNEIDASGGAIGGRGKVKAGYICGIVGCVLWVIGVVLRVTVLANNN